MSLTTVNIPDSVESIGSNAFSGTNIKSITMPLGLEYFRCNIIGGMNVLETVIFPENFEYVDEFAFKDMETLPNIVLPSTIYLIDEYAFAGCKDITSVVFANEGSFGFDATTGVLLLPTSCEMIESNAFNDCANLLTIVISNETISNGLEYSNNFGRLIQNAEVVYILTGLSTENSTYLTTNYTKQTTSDKAGYDKWIKNSN